MIVARRWKEKRHAKDTPEEPGLRARRAGLRRPRGRAEIFARNELAVRRLRGPRRRGARTDAQARSPRGRPAVHLLRAEVHDRRLPLHGGDVPRQGAAGRESAAAPFRRDRLRDRHRDEARGLPRLPRRQLLHRHGGGQDLHRERHGRLPRARPRGAGHEGHGGLSAAGGPRQGL